MNKLALPLLLLAALVGCAEKEPAPFPPLEDEPQIGRAQAKDLPELIPAYGITTGKGERTQLVVNIEAEDSPLIHPGQKALAYILPSTQPLACRVARIMEDASAETGQSIAWLQPEAGISLPENDFVFASITVAVKKQVLTVPKQAVMVSDGKTMVVRRLADKDGKYRFEPAEVETGEAAGGSIEITSGLKAGDEIVTSGGIGLLFADFKANQAD